MSILTHPLKKAAEEQGEQAQKAFERMETQLGGVTELPVEVWIDEEGLVRRYQMSMPLPVPPEGAAPGGAPKEPAPPAAQGEGRITVVEELYDFGTPVNVEPPPAEQVADLEEIMEAQQRRQAPGPR